MKIEIDQARIAADLAALTAAQLAPPTSRGLPEIHIWHWPRRNGKASAAPPPPWEPIGPGVWIAPYGTPMPEPNWADVTEVVEEFAAADTDGAIARYLLQEPGHGQIVSAPMVADPDPGNPLEDLRSWMRLYRDKDLPPARRLEAGDAAIAAINAGTPCASTTPDWRQVTTINDLTGIPIVRAEDLPTNAWRLVDARTGEVVDSGTMGASVEECERIVRQYLEDLAEEAEIPRHLLF